MRIGNAAYLQRQNDLMGTLILSLDSLLSDPRIGEEDPARHMPLVERLVEEAIRAAGEPDTGIWEYRSMFRRYTYSRAMCWAAIYRGARIAERYGDADLAEMSAIVKDEDKCIRCALCAERCPVGAITMERYRFARRIEEFAV